MVLNHHCFRNADFEAPTVEAAPSFGRPRYNHEEAAPSSWEQLCQLDEVAEDLSFENFLCTTADTDETTMEALDEGR